MSHHLLTPGIWYSDPVHQGDRPVLGVIAGERASLLVDGGNGAAHVRQTLDFVRELDIPPLSAVCLTHYHWDHVLGLSHTGLPVIASAATKEKVARLATYSWDDAALDRRVEAGTESPFCREHIKIEYPDSNRRVEIKQVDAAFDHTLVLDLGGATAHLRRVDCDHTDDCVIIHIPEAGVVFLGDCLYSCLESGSWYLNPQRYSRLLRELTALEARWYLPSHQEPYSAEAFADFVEEQQRLIAAAGSHTEEECAKADFLAQNGREATEEELEVLGDLVQGNVRAVNS